MEVSGPVALHDVAIDAEVVRPDAERAQQACHLLGGDRPTGAAELWPRPLVHPPELGEDVAGGQAVDLTTVEQIMHQGEAIPSVGTDVPLRETIYEMSGKGLGITAVVDHQGRLVGAVSDGDLRRLLEEDRGGRSDLLDRSAKSCMRPTPKTIPKNALVLDALQSMEDHRITSLFVCDQEERLIGVVHIHDLWGLQLR